MPVERELTLEERMELLQELNEARSLLPESVESSDGAAVVQAVSELVDAVRSKPGSLNRPVEEVGFAAGMLLGHAIVDGIGWSWTHITYDNGFDGVCVSNDDRSFVCFPFHYTYELMRDASKENTLGTLWQMLEGGGTPPATPGAYLPLA